MADRPRLVYKTCILIRKFAERLGIETTPGIEGVVALVVIWLGSSCEWLQLATYIKIDQPINQSITVKYCNKEAGMLLQGGKYRFNHR